MFPAQVEGQWEPYKVLEQSSGAKPASSEPVEGGGTENQPPQEPEFYEDFESEEGAVWPLQEGRITNWSCFFGLLSYVYNRLDPHLGSPILLVAQPAWTAKDYERLTQFFFEKFKPPGFTIVDSALTSLWAYNTANACVIDVGYDKTDVTAITDFSIHIPGRGIAVTKTGGAALSERLFELLEPKGFTKDMIEQLKQSSICEILPAGVPLPGSSTLELEVEPPPPVIAPPSASKLGGDAAAEGPGSKDDIENEGVLDVASIVAAGQNKMEEFLAKKEKEKVEKVVKKKGADAAAALPKQVKLRNSEKERATFIYEEHVSRLQLLEQKKVAAAEPAANGGESTAEQNGEANGTDGADGETTAEPQIVGGRRVIQREVTVGVERLQAASGGLIDRIADAIHLAVSSVDDVSKRSEVWDSLVLVGNGARLRGKLYSTQVCCLASDHFPKDSKKLYWLLSSEDTLFLHRQPPFLHRNCRRISPRQREPELIRLSHKPLVASTLALEAASIRFYSPPLHRRIHISTLKRHCRPPTRKTCIRHMVRRQRARNLRRWEITSQNGRMSASTRLSSWVLRSWQRCSSLLIRD
jgi:actin-related protein 9